MKVRVLRVPELFRPRRNVSLDCPMQKKISRSKQYLFGTNYIDVLDMGFFFDMTFIEMSLTRVFNRTIKKKTVSFHFD